MKEKTAPYARIMALFLGSVAAMALILDASTAAEAVRSGISLCLWTVIPALFPFMVLARMAVGAFGHRTAGIGKLMGAVFGLPAQSALALVMGAIGGYPIGAQVTADLRRSGAITRQDGERILAFCSNAGPAFLFGMIGGLLGDFRVAAVLYAIHLLSALLTGIFFRPHRQAAHRPLNPPLPVGTSVDLTSAVSSSIRAMGNICGYVILIQVVSAFINKACGLWMPQEILVGITGFLELSGGCCRLTDLTSVGVRYCMASFFLGFGGICVWLQTKAVLKGTDLTGKFYLYGKTLQAVIAVLLTWGCMVFFPNYLPRELPVAALPNHDGLLRSLGVVVGSVSLLFAVWCISLRKRAGKQGLYGV